ncbi:MAG: undecaprenyl/decaprenyl-phosphate alpha-N-acetylglucosaminyl 1-phosphate transferase, partial [Endomicrobia bacterium]|nr:undecaprenyl/decaprenyl-phosphate alpha-N-acetylglucosaminyl 1-phosphate transferase [Endomicrobiia bacterium]
MKKDKIAQVLLFGFILCLLFVREIGRQAYILNLRWLYLVILSFSISYFLVPFTIKIAHKFNILDYPSERKIHLTPTPRIGGVAIYLSILLTLLRNVQFTREILGLIISVGIIFIVSILDDIYGISAGVRLIAQVVATVVVVIFGFRITAVPSGFPLEYVLEVLITIIWFVGITNAINFLDGIDGLVSSFGTFCSLLFLFISLTTGQKFVSYLCSALLGSCLGLLPYNWYKA